MCGCARVVVSEMATPCVLETNFLHLANLYDERVRELETHCFVHTVEIDVVVNYTAPSF